MLIIKKFHDYYDTAMGSTGIDKTCVYQRTPFYDKDQYEFKKNFKLFEIEKTDYAWRTRPYSYNLSKRNNEWKEGELRSAEPFVIGFCGKTYVGYVFRFYHAGDTYGISNDKIKITYSIDEFLALLNLKDKKILTSEYYYSKTDYPKVVEYYNRFHGKEHKELFVEKHVPIFVCDFDTMINSQHDRKANPVTIDYAGRVKSTDDFIMYNPCLKDYEFYRLFNPAQAFQEIQMYLQGVLGSIEKDSRELTDKEKVVNHGMDNWSFRNPNPPKRKMK